LSPVARSRIDETERTKRVLHCVTVDELLKLSPFDGWGGRISDPLGLHWTALCFVHGEGAVREGALRSEIGTREIN
jgi:hypothetical protein